MKTLLRVGIALILVPLSWAASYIPMSLDEMVDQSAYIVSATATGKQSQWNDDRTQIFTTISFRVSEDFLGNNPGGTQLTLRLLGGVIEEEDIAMNLGGWPEFEVGQEYLLLLDENIGSAYPFVGSIQGVFSYVNDPSRGKVAVNDAGLTYSGNELRTNVSARIAAMEGKTPGRLTQLNSASRADVERVRQALRGR